MQVVPDVPGQLDSREDLLDAHYLLQFKSSASARIDASLTGWGDVRTELFGLPPLSCS